MDQRSRNCRFVGGIEIFAVHCWKNCPNFEMLVARIASALNKIIRNSQFKKKVSLEEQKAKNVDWFLRGRQIAFVIYDYFRVTGAHDTVLDCTILISVTLHDDNEQEFDTRWDEVLLSMSKIPSDDVLDTSAAFACWKIRFKTEVCICSQFRTEAMMWIKEVEIVELVDELRSSSSIRGISIPDFEVLDAKNASALNWIIHNTSSKERSVWRNKKAQKEDRFLRGKQIAYLIYEYFRVTGANDSVENYADLFTIILRNDDIQEFDSKWDGILLTMTKIPSDDILEGLYKLRIRESEKLKTVLELYDMEIHQKKIGPDYHRLKTMVKRSIEQNLRNRNFEARNGNSEKTPWSSIRGQNSVNKEL